MGRKSEIRLYVDGPLGAGQAIALGREQAHYLFSVMRRQVGDAVLVFDGQSGEWRATIAEAGRKGGSLVCDAHTKAQAAAPDLWLAFAPIRKTRMEVLVEKACEIGVLRLQPVITEYTDKAALRLDRLSAIAIEAEEQSRALTVTDVAAPLPLSELLKAWPSERVLVFADEAAEVGKPQWPGAPAGILVGPEGGFSPPERAAIRALPQARAVSLGPRTLRAETAAIVALARWHEAQL